MNLKSAIEKLKSTDELLLIDREINWKYELGAICRENSSIPCLFTTIKDYDNFSLFTGSFSSLKSICIVLGMEHKTNFNDVCGAIRKRLKNKEKPQIDNSTFSQNGFFSVMPVDLFSLPVPWWDERDQGRYIGTWHANISRDMENQNRNVGIYRMMVVDKKHTTISVSNKSHLAKQFLKAEKNGVDLEMVTAIGTQEEIVMAASAAVPYGVDELEIAGAISNQHVTLGKCETIALEYPVESEIILEGRIKAGVRVTDGPFADYTGITNTNNNALLYEVTALHCRKNCIFRGMSVGKAGAEDHRLLSILALIGMMNFHGSTFRNVLQTLLLRFQFYSLFQIAGRTKIVTHKKQDL